MKLIKKKYRKLFGQKLMRAENLSFKDLTEKEKEELKELNRKDLINDLINQAVKKLDNVDFNNFMFNYGYNYFYDYVNEILRDKVTKRFYYKNCFKLDDIITDFVVYDYINNELNY